MLRATVAVVIITLGSTLEAVAAAYLPAGYTTGLSVLVPLTAFAAVAWAFVPSRKGR
jgi:hypothetical protein